MTEKLHDLRKTLTDSRFHPGSDWQRVAIEQTMASLEIVLAEMKEMRSKMDSMQEQIDSI